MLKDRIAIIEEEEVKRDREEMENEPSVFDSNENLLIQMNTYRFTADGHISVNYKEEEGISLFKRLIDETVVGNKIYLLSYSEGYPGAYETGWVVIYDVDVLFSRVFTEKESILSAVGTEHKEVI